MLREERALIRERPLVESPQASQLTIDGRQYVNFSSNDYLGLACQQRTLEHIKGEIGRLGFGSGGSHMVSGHHQQHELLEKELAAFQNRDAAVTFSSGYSANLAILQTLAKKGDLIIADKLNHASLIDGARLSSADSIRYNHCDIEALERRLKKSAKNRWVVTDSIFSMDGDLAPLDKIADLCIKYSAHLIVDDAHGFGVLGKNGKGCIEHFGLTQNQLPVVMGTLGKALGGYGAFVSGSQSLINYLIQFARPYIYTTAMPAIVAAANRFNLDWLRHNPEQITKLQNNIEFFKCLCRRKEINCIPSDSAIQPIIIGNTEKLLTINSRLRENGILVGAIRPPTVAPNTDRLRITLSANHCKNDIEQLVENLWDIFSACR
jgi:8-amino-7-oxononanoate synthase